MLIIHHHVLYNGLSGTRREDHNEDGIENVDHWDHEYDHNPTPQCGNISMFGSKIRLVPIDATYFLHLLDFYALRNANLTTVITLDI